MTSRPANRALVEALQDQGFRPVAIDRPGFGDTDPAPPDCVGEAFFDLAARDIIDFCTAMGWPRILLVSRGAAQVVVALHRAQPDLTEAAIVMNPDPDAGSSSRQTGFLAVMKKNFVRRPWAVGLMTRWIAQSLTYARVRDHVLRSTADCPVDRRIMERPQHMADYYRGLAAFRRGCLDGFCREQAALATMGKPDPIPGTPHLTLLVGEYDSIHDPHETLHYWRDVLPDAQVLFEPGSGRFMSYSHAQTVAKRLSAR
jgi:pimeloyl-ACP methyl ester carboxylesterase